MSSGPCFHCGEPIPTGVRLIARLNDQPHQVCCIGCQAAVEWIATLGLNDYYRMRDRPADRVVSGADFATWDRPQLQRLYVRSNANHFSEACVLVEGLHCAACSWLIDRALSSLPGVREVSVNIAAKRLHVAWIPDQIRLSAILGRLACLGYVPHPLNAQSLDALGQREQRAALKRLAVAGLGMMQAMMYTVALYAGTFEGMPPTTRDFFRWVGLLITTPVVAYAAQPFFTGAWREWRVRRLGMDTPVALAIGLVFLASVFETLRSGAHVYFDSASMFVFLLLGGRYLEMRGRHRAADIVDALACLQPSLAQRRTRLGTLETIGVHELQCGDTVAIAPGSAVPADGTLLSASCEVDEALLSGESTPRTRQRGQTLMAGSIVRTGPVELRVEHIGADTVLSSIVRLVTRAQQQRPRWTQIGDRFAAGFVVSVLVLTLLTACAWWWVDPTRAFAAALAVLVVSCPCAFALSVPTALTRAIAVLARSGVLVIKPDALERLVGVSCFVFDKTGTLTRNRLELTGITAVANYSIADCWCIAAQLEQTSTHPIAQAIRANAPEEPSAPATNVKAIAGVGIEGDINGVHYRFGRADFALAPTAKPQGLPADSRLVLADKDGVLAYFALSETLREDAVGTVDALHTMGMDTHILSGDSASRVQAIAAKLRINGWRAELAPAAKLDHLQTLHRSGAVVAVVGDGINDAPVLAGADVAIAIGSGTQLAHASADIVLANDRLDTLIGARTLAMRTFRILKQNLIWALVYNLSSIPLAAFGLVPPWLAAIGMSGSSLLVILNSLRIASAPAAIPPQHPAVVGNPVPA